MKDKTTVSIAQCSSYDDEVVANALERLLEPLGGMAAFVPAGSKVFIKPNLLLAAKPDAACTTHPSVMKAVVRAVQAAGGEVFFGDLPGGFHVGNAGIISEKCGMNQVAEETGGTLVRLEKHGFREVIIPGGRKVKTIHTPQFLEDMDVLISIPKLKTHMQTIYTGAVKNLFGFITTRDRMHAHRYTSLPDFSEALVDIYSVLKPQLNIMDAVVGMEGTGPSQGAPVKLGFLAAAVDAVALDTVAAAATGFAPGEVLTTVLAGKRGLGESNLENINVAGVPVSQVKKKLRRPMRVVFNTLPAISDIMNELTKVSPVINAKKCKKCRACVEVCPVAAISTSENFKINDKKCILCFCCHEVCPHSAVVLHKAPLVPIVEFFTRNR